MRVSLKQLGRDAISKYKDSVPSPEIRPFNFHTRPFNLYTRPFNFYRRVAPHRRAAEGGPSIMEGSQKVRWRRACASRSSSWAATPFRSTRTRYPPWSRLRGRYLVNFHGMLLDPGSILRGVQSWEVPFVLMLSSGWLEGGGEDARLAQAAGPRRYFEVQGLGTSKSHRKRKRVSI